MLIRALVTLPFHSRQCCRSNSMTVTAFAATPDGLSHDRPSPTQISSRLAGGPVATVDLVIASIARPAGHQRCHPLRCGLLDGCGGGVNPWDS